MEGIRSEVKPKGRRGRRPGSKNKPKDTPKSTPEESPKEHPILTASRIIEKYGVRSQRPNSASLPTQGRGLVEILADEYAKQKAARDEAQAKMDYLDSIYSQLEGGTAP
ncbi:MAG: hypothetical protein R3B95_11475 [Nitrospirales bacterium]|nr:hypothetical protein [Nitrospirales bacterium]